MDAREFVSCWKAEKDAILARLRNGEGLAGEQIQALGLTPRQSEGFWVAMDTTLTDTFYSLLLGLDGSAQIGGVQHAFEIRDEEGHLVSECGDIEVAAFEAFHNPD